MKKFTLLLSAMLFSVMSFAGLGEGYTKVTDITTLAAGDKVVLYSDDAKLGITGWDGNKTATAAAAGWVEYVVEAAAGGVLLKDGDQYIALTAKNAFYYNATGSVCKVTTDGILYVTFNGADYLLYENANNGSPLYRMYVDKTGNSQYKPFYVYKVGEGGGSGSTTDPELSTTITSLNYADALYVVDEEYGDYWAFDLYNNWDEDVQDYVYPDLYLIANEVHSATAINGTYNLLFSEYLPNAETTIASDESAEDFVGTLTIKNVDDQGNYSFKGSFVATDGKTYTFDQMVEVFAYKYTEEDGVPVVEQLTLNEGGNSGNTGNTDTPADAIIFDADVDKGNATETQAEYTITKDGVTLTVSSGRLGTFNNETHYRIYKNQTLTITSTVGNIVSVEFTCTANDDAQYGPGCFTVAAGSYTYSGPVGTWTGSADEVVFNASINQVRASQIVVKVAQPTAVDNLTMENAPVKVLNNGQLYIIRGENTYNVLGATVK